MSTLRNAIPVLLAVLGATACTVQPLVQPGAPAASLAAQIRNDSSGTMLLRHGVASAFASPSCNGRQLMAQRMMMAADDTLPHKAIPAGQPFTFNVGTHNAQSFRGNWGCAAAATFTPAPGGVYTSILTTNGDSSSCSMVVVDQNQVPVAMSTPANSCEPLGNKILPNGQGYRIVHRTI